MERESERDPMSMGIVANREITKKRREGYSRKSYICNEKSQFINFLLGLFLCLNVSFFFLFFFPVKLGQKPMKLKMNFFFEKEVNLKVFSHHN
jgi:hypothetical protein